MGLLDPSGPGMAVVESHPEEGDMILAFGLGRSDPLGRLLDLIDRAPIDMRRLAVSAFPAAHDFDDRGALATLVRPNFTFVIRPG